MSGFSREPTVRAPEGEHHECKTDETRIADARSELEQTLEAIEDKLNVPKQVGELITWGASYERNPLPWIIGAVGAGGGRGGGGGLGHPERRRPITTPRFVSPTFHRGG